MLRYTHLRTPLRSAIRAYSARAGAVRSLADIDASKLTITRTETPKALKKPEELKFGHNFTGTACFLTPNIVN